MGHNTQIKMLEHEEQNAKIRILIINLLLQYNNHCQENFASVSESIENLNNIINHCTGDIIAVKPFYL